MLKMQTVLKFYLLPVLIGSGETIYAYNNELKIDWKNTSSWKSNKEYHYFNIVLKTKDKLLRDVVYCLVDTEQGNYNMN